MKKKLYFTITILLLSTFLFIFSGCQFNKSDSVSASDSPINRSYYGNTSYENVGGLNFINSNGTSLSPTEVAAKIIPSTVCILNYQNGSLVGTGSGVIFRIKDNVAYIVTNAHVVEDQTSLSVILYDDNVRDAELIASDVYTDLAIVKIDSTSLDIIAANFSSSAALAVGNYVMACGSPGGTSLRNSVTLGIVSGLNRNIETVSGYTVNCIQVDAAINPGNSGGALVNMEGNVIGIPSSKIVSESYEGLGFAISSDFAQEIIEELLTYGYVRGRASLGITLEQKYVRSSIGYFGYTIRYTVTAISNSSAIEAGIKVGDYILKIDGKTLSSTDDTAAILKDKSPGDNITVTIQRNNQNYDITFKLVELT